MQGVRAVKHEDVLEAISQIHLGIRRYLQAGLETQGLTLNQNKLLLMLRRRPFVYPSDAADLLNCDRPTASVIIRNLEKKEWVAREPDPESRRRVRIVLTEAGRAKADQTLAWGRRFKGDFEPMLNIPDEDIAPLKRSLETIRAYVSGKLDDVSSDTAKSSEAQRS